MKIQDIQRRERKVVVISVRTSVEKAKWMKEHIISPTALFNKSLDELIIQNK